MLSWRTKLAAGLALLSFGGGVAWFEIKDYLMQRSWPGWHVDYKAPLGGRMLVTAAFVFFLTMLVSFVLDVVARKKQKQTTGH